MRYFEWIGAAVYTADRRAGAMHGKQFLLDAVHAGIDNINVYGRLDFTGSNVPSMNFDLVVNLESRTEDGLRPRRAVRLDAMVTSGKLAGWKITAPDEETILANYGPTNSEATIALGRNFEFKLPLAWLLAAPVAPTVDTPKTPVVTKLRLRFSLWQHGLPVDALPVEGWMELQLLSEPDLIALAQ